MLNGPCLAESWKRRVKTSTGGLVPAEVPLGLAETTANPSQPHVPPPLLLRACFLRLPASYLSSVLSDTGIKLSIRWINKC